MSPAPAGIGPLASLHLPAPRRRLDRPASLCRDRLVGAGLALALLTALSGCAGRREQAMGAAVPAPARAAALVLDGAMAHPSVHRALLARLAAAGLVPTYRRYDPRLGEADPDRYGVVVWLAGWLRGSRGSLAVEEVEIERAVRLVERGGRLVLGVAPGGRPSAEARAFQAILDRLDVPVAIEAHEVVDLAPESSYPASLFRAPLFVPDPGHPAGRELPPRIVGERSAPLRVGPGAAALLWTLPTAFLDRFYGPLPDDPTAFGRRPVAAEGRAGRRGGRVLVASRFLLDAGGGYHGADSTPLLPERLPPGALEGRERFLAALLREFLGEAAKAPAAGPAGTAAGAAPPAARCGAWRPGEAWIEQEGLRAGWGYVDRPDAEVDALLAHLPPSGLNALWGPARWDGLAWPARDRAEAAAARRRLGRIDAALRGTRVRWLAGIDVPGRPADVAGYPRAVAITGVEVAVPSLVDPRLWEERIVPQVEALAAAAAYVAPLAGVVLDLEMYGMPVLYYGDGFDFGDGPFSGFLDGLPEGDDPAGVAAARRLPASGRGDWLLSTGRLPAYYAWLERRAEAIGRRLRAALDAAAPPGRDLVLGFYAAGILPSWFYRGLWRGASAGGRPVLLLTFEVEAAADLAEATADGICARHALAALLGLVGPEGLEPALVRAARDHDGFWLNRITTLVAPSGAFEAVETPAEVGGDAAWRWIAAAVEAFGREWGRRAGSGHRD